jgi:hypothetical protein
MESFELKNMFKGWFIGNFEPTLYNTSDVEVAIKTYSINDYEEPHYHKISTEFTAIIEGIVEMNGMMYKEGDIIKIEPNEITNFKALSNVKTVVVKIPGAINDKYNI